MIVDSIVYIYMMFYFFYLKKKSLFTLAIFASGWKGNDLFYGSSKVEISIFWVVFSTFRVTSDDDSRRYPEHYK